MTYNIRSLESRVKTARRFLGSCTGVRPDLARSVVHTKGCLCAKRKMYHLWFPLAWLQSCSEGCESERELQESGARSICTLSSAPAALEADAVQ